VVRETADGPALRRTSTRRAALVFATDLLFRGRGGDIHVHEADGPVVETYRVAARGPRPWWYAPPRLFGLFTGAFFLFEGVIDIRADGRLLPWLGWFLVVTGILQIASLVLSRRADRRFKAQQAPLAPPSRDGGQSLDQG